MSEKDNFRTEADEAYAKYKSNINVTPLMLYDDLSTDKIRVWVKCENLQKTGSFKARGAMSSCQDLLSKNSNAKTVVTHSSGNFAQALSWAAGQLDLIAEIVMPDNAPKTKIEGVRKHKGNITFSASTQEAREAAAQKIVNDTGGFFMHPYNDPRVIRGQASIAIEIEKQLEEVGGRGKDDIIMVPVGGGGMIGGIAKYTNCYRVLGGEPEIADDACRSKHEGNN
jgi:threonine dehydratase